jgi:response regulator RpfG family c-di-GMP phosphodiesterase
MKTKILLFEDKVNDKLTAQNGCSSDLPCRSMKNTDEQIKNIFHNTEEKKINILYVENDEDLLNLVDIAFNDFADVTRASNLREAKEIILQNKFDLIILDYVFPEGTSDKLIPSIKSCANKDAKIIIFSSYEESKILSKYVDKIIIKTNMSFEEFKVCVEELVKE